MRSHGLSDHPIYQIWQQAKGRCFNKKNQAYKNYGERGISMCDEWVNDPQAFYDYVTSLPGYEGPGLTLDRENNDGNYEPGNLRWATWSEQLFNRRTIDRPHKSSGYCGIIHHKKKGTRPWQAMITINRRNRSLGYFDSVNAAIERRNNYILTMGVEHLTIQNV